MGPTMEDQAPFSENHPRFIYAPQHRSHHCVYINGVQIQKKESAKYLRLDLDSKLTWKYHLKQKASQVKQKINKMYWLIG